MKIVTAAQMRALDQAAIQERGIPSLQLMDRAAAAVTERCLARLAPTAGRWRPIWRQWAAGWRTLRPLRTLRPGVWAAI